MTVVIALMAAQGVLGAFDTAYYHEYRARLPAGGARTRPELRLHAARDFIYAVLFFTLPWVAWSGAWAVVLAALIVAEIAITMADFAIEVRVRAPVGVPAGERITHGVMAVIYGAVLAELLPQLLRWADAPTGWHAHAAAVPAPLAAIATLMGVGVLVSGMRDVYAVLGLPRCGYPWDRPSVPDAGPDVILGRSGDPS